MTQEAVAVDTMLEVPVLYLDIDGTVRKGLDEIGRFVNDATDVEVFPEAKILIENWKKGDGRVVGVSNQGGVGLGHLSIFAMRGAMNETNHQVGDLFDRMMVCPHAPREKCECRKPGTWMVLKAQLEMAKLFPGEKYPNELALFVGDRPEDRECAQACGIAFMDAAEWRAQVNGM